jgi:hypothetical protein
MGGGVLLFNGTHTNKITQGKKHQHLRDGDGLSPLLVNKPLRKQHDVAKKLEKKEEGICSLFFGFLQSTKQIPSFFCHF